MRFFFALPLFSAAFALNASQDEINAAQKDLDALVSNGCSTLSKTSHPEGKEFPVH